MDPKMPEMNDTQIDASDVPIVAVTTRQISKFSKTRSGYETAIACFLRLSPALLERAGIDPKLGDKAAAFLSTDKRCNELLPATEKLVQLLRETRHHARHELAGILSEVARQASYRAERDPYGDEIIAALEELLEYQYGPAAKANATKKKTKAAKRADRPAETPREQNGNP